MHLDPRRMSHPPRSTRSPRRHRLARCCLATLAGVALAAFASPARAQLATAGDSAAPAPRPAAPLAGFSASALALRDSLVARARAQLGRRYVTGGESPERGCDCSGLVQYVVETLGLDVPRTAARQARVGQAVPMDTSRLRPGDLLTFGGGRRASHIGIYVGDGRFIHASSKAGRVIESPLNRPLVRGVKPWRGARRLLVASADSAEPASALAR